LQNSQDQPKHGRGSKDGKSVGYSGGNGIETGVNRNSETDKTILSKKPKKRRGKEERKKILGGERHASGKLFKETGDRRKKRERETLRKNNAGKKK